MEVAISLNAGATVTYTSRVFDALAAITAENNLFGGGLVCLVTAFRLHQAGMGFRLLEARDRLGGRILSARADGLPSADGFDLGPPWFWPGLRSDLGDWSMKWG